MNDLRERRLQRQRNWAFVVAGVCLVALGTFAILDRRSDSALLQSQVSSPQGSNEEEQGSDRGRSTSEATEQDPIQARVGDVLSSGEATEDAPSNASLVSSTPARVAESGSSEGSPSRKFVDGLALNDGPVQLNAQFESEPRDAVWANHTETQLEDFVARHPYASAYQNQTFECRETLCQFYAELEPAMVQAIQQSSMGQIDPFTGLQHESLSTELQQISGSFGPNPESGRPAMLIVFRRLKED